MPNFKLLYSIQILLFRHISCFLSTFGWPCVVINSYDPARKLSANLYDIHHCRVYSEKPLVMDRRTVRKNVKVYSKNKFEKLAHLVGFIIRIPASYNHLKQEIIINCILTREGAPSKTDRTYLSKA